MSQVHVVRPGECLSRIARHYGFKDARVLYDDPANAELKRRRPNPNVLMAGDLVAIPFQRFVDANKPTGDWHELNVEFEQPRLKVRLQGIDGKALAGQSYQLLIDGDSREGTTDGDGLLDEPVAAEVKTAVLKTTVTRGEQQISLTYRLTIGGLDPTTECTGLQARLANLQFYGGAIDGNFGPRTRGALMAFQKQAGLEPTGAPDDATVQQLQQQHDGAA